MQAHPEFSWRPLRPSGFFLPLILAFILFIAVQSAYAHGYIVRAIPENRAVLDHPPARLQYWFSEGLEPDFSELRPRPERGHHRAGGRPKTTIH
jgi:methionine-rich copper-binding protein CopC